MKTATKALEKVLNYLEPLLPLANCHMVDFFTESLYENYIPYEIRTEIEQIGYDEALKCIWDANATQNCDNLKDFISRARSFSLRNQTSVCLSKTEFEARFNSSEQSGVQLDVFMSSKKSHEVEILTKVINIVHRTAETEVIIDAGDGRGYLSSALAFGNNLHILGVDSSGVNTQSAGQRAKRLGKAWKGQNIDVDQYYKRTTHLLSEETDFAELVRGYFPHKNTSLINLVGLHTCGDLAATCIRVFERQSSVRALCNVGCCYHLLSEPDTFPLSALLRSSGFRLGRNARMLSSQSIERILSKKKFDNIDLLLYRSLLQVLFMKYCPELRDERVGKTPRNCYSFLYYVRDVFSRLGVECPATDDDVNALYDLYRVQLQKLHLVYVLRAHLASVVEAAILLDRLLYLRELGYERSHLVHLFEPVVSPRCYAIVAFK